MSKDDPVLVSIIVEWANTRLNGVPRAHLVLDEVLRQWQALIEGERPDTPLPEAGPFLERLAPRAELIVVSGEAIDEPLQERIRRTVGDVFDLQIHAIEGLEYYPLKNFGAKQAKGDVMLFLDSDVLPDPGFFAHLLGTFGRSDVDVVSGQTYVAPTDLFSRAYALGWTYQLRDFSGRLHQPTKIYANNLAFRRNVFPDEGFPSLGKRTRGAASVLLRSLREEGIPVWENVAAGVGHPPPADFRHVAIRGLAHGRDIYMRTSEERQLASLQRSVSTALRRFARGCATIMNRGREVGLRAWEVPLAIAIIGGYYGCFAMGGILTHVDPERMGRSFRV